MTTLTDFLLFLVAWMLGWRLMKNSGSQGTLAKFFWGQGLCTIGYAAALGGINHGFLTPEDTNLKFLLWRATMWCIGLAGSQFLASVFLVTFPLGRIRTMLIDILLLLTGVYLVWVMLYYDFIAVVIWLSATLSILALFCATSGNHKKWLLSATCLTGFGMGLWSVSVSLNSYINHNDLYHLIQLGAVYLFYRAGKELQDA